MSNAVSPLFAAPVSSMRSMANGIEAAEVFPASLDRSLQFVFAVAFDNEALTCFRRHDFKVIGECPNAKNGIMKMLF